MIRIQSFKRKWKRSLQMEKITISEFKAFAKHHNLNVSLLDLPNVIAEAKKMGMLK